MIPNAERVRPGIAAIGRLVEDEGRRRRWVTFVERLHDLASPGGPLEGWLFHGTERHRGASIRLFGMEATTACVNGPGRARDRWRWTRGTHWGSPSVASFYAEDLIEGLGEQILFSMVAARVRDLEARGALRADGQSVDCPPWSRLGVEGAEAEAAAWGRWDASARDWRASMELTGSIVCLAPVPARDLRVLDDEGDLERWLAGPQGRGVVGRGVVGRGVVGRGVVLAAGGRDGRRGGDEANPG